MNNEFTTATYNIMFAMNREKIVENIKEMAEKGVSLYCLQEIINYPNVDFMIDAMLKVLGDDWKASYHVGPEMTKESIGTAILWNTKKFKLKQEEKILLPKLPRFDLHEQFYYKVIGVAGITLQRKAITCYFQFENKEIRVTSVHLDNVGGPKHRHRQFAYLTNKLKAMKTPDHEIIAGDFNTFDLLKTGIEKKFLQKELGSEFVDASKPVDWTSDIHMIDFKTSLPIFPWFINTFNVHVRRRLDYIWTKNFAVEACHKLQLAGSDHYPIIAKLKIN